MTAGNGLSVSSGTLSMLSTNDGVKNLKLYIEGVAGVNLTASFGERSESNPYKVFFEDSSNFYEKTVVVDGGNCTFPEVFYSFATNSPTHVHYFNMKNVRLENINVKIGIDGSFVSSDKRLYYSCGFYGCSNLYNCVSLSKGVGGSNQNRGYGYGFNMCKNLFGCIGIGEGMGVSTLFFGEGYGYGFYDCEQLVSCVGYGYRAERESGESSGFKWTSPTMNIAQMTNCIAPIKPKAEYTQDYGILLDGTTSGAKYSLIGNTIAPDSSTFVGIKKHTKTGSEYTETGTIRANLEVVSSSK